MGMLSRYLPTGVQNITLKLSAEFIIMRGAQPTYSVQRVKCETIDHGHGGMHMGYFDTGILRKDIIDDCVSELVVEFVYEIVKVDGKDISEVDLEQLGFAMCRREDDEDGLMEIV